MEIKGKLAQKFAATGGVGKTGKQWNKIEFLLEKKGKFPSKVLLIAFDSIVIGFIEDTSIGTELLCTIDVESREWQGRYFTDCKCYKVETYRDNKPDIDPTEVDKSNPMGFPRNEPANFQNPEEMDDSLPF